MINYSVYVSYEAEKDLTEIYGYIKYEFDNLISANKLIEKVRDSILSLEMMPYRYNIVKDGRLASYGIRMMMVNNYAVFYTVDENAKRVYVVRVLYAKRDWINIF